MSDSTSKESESTSEVRVHTILKTLKSLEKHVSTDSTIFERDSITEAQVQYLRIVLSCVFKEGELNAIRKCREMLK